MEMVSAGVAWGKKMEKAKDKDGHQDHGQH